MVDGEKLTRIYNMCLKRDLPRLESFFAKNGKLFDEGHGLSHALKVGENCYNALCNYEGVLQNFEIFAVIRAGFYHDLDDGKFTKTINYENARLVAKGLPDAQVDLIIKMIDLVSCSKNGNLIDTRNPVWMYYPRWADRIESLGKRGVEECLAYTHHVGRPYFVAETARVKNLDELNEVATQERFAAYHHGRKTSPDTMIDHYYDKTVHLCVDTGNAWLNEQMREGMVEIHKVLFRYGGAGNNPCAGCVVDKCDIHST